MTRNLLLLTVILLATASFATAQDKGPKIPDGIKFEPDLVFGKGGDVELTLDLARPEKLDKPAPCIVFIHGGGWRGGNRKVHDQHIVDFAKRGYVTATLQYRLVPSARFPAQIEDVKCGIRYLRTNADKYQLDPKKIGAVGFSAGAHLVMMLGVMDEKDGLEGTGGHADQPSKVNAVVAFFGPTDLGASDIPAISGGMVNDFLNSTKEENPEIRKTASPITYVDKADAPLLIYQGTKDPLVPHTQAFLMADAMTKAGMPGRIELLIGGAHGWGNPELNRTVEGTLAFFAEHLK
jgi:acetyl esterase/lipase